LGVIDNKQSAWRLKKKNKGGGGKAISWNLTGREKDLTSDGNHVKKSGDLSWGRTGKRGIIREKKVWGVWGSKEGKRKNIVWGKSKRTLKETN